MEPNNETAHNRALLAAHLRRMLAVAELLAQRPDDVNLGMDHDQAVAAINDRAARLGLRSLPDGLPQIAEAAGLLEQVRASLQRQQQRLIDYRRATEIQQIMASPTSQVELSLKLQQADQRLSELASHLAALNPIPATPEPSVPAKEKPVMTASTGLSPDQLRRLRILLKHCDEHFDTNRDLRALFADERISLWRGSLPEADNLSARVDRVIDYMRDKRNTAGQSGLVLLLWVLSDKYDPTDQRRDMLLALASELEYGLRIILPPNSSNNPQLERKIRASNSMFDLRAWMARVAVIERSLCRISIAWKDGSATFGTGFLVAPDLVITNYHVLEQVISGKEASSGVSLLFDYHILEDGVTPHSGPSYKLVESNWLVDSSPYSQLDLQPTGAAVPDPSELDYVLLRVAGTPGTEMINTGAQAGPRGYLKLRDADYGFAPNTPLLIVQHPEGKELKLAMDTDAIIELNRNRTRVRYRTNTEPGSSGSPCFDANWNLVALHHSGDPNYAQLNQQSYNQGIPIAAIVKLLKQRKKLDLLGYSTE